jgi:predicted permease
MRERPSAPSDWPAIVRRHARARGVDLPVHAVDELAAHLEDLAATARAAGRSDAEARDTALRALASSPLGALQGRPRGRRRETALASANGFAMLTALRQAVRQFRHHPTFALVTVLVLGLGTGASVAVYTVLDAVLLRPLPYRDPSQLVMVWDANPERGLPRERLSPVTFMDYAALDVFAGAAAWWRPDVNLADPGSDPVRIRTIEAGANLFQILGVSPQLGPGFPADGPLYSPDLVAVISDRLWRQRYSASQDIVGRLLSLNGTPYRIVGVMPPGFDFPGDIDIWQRARWDFRLHSRGAHFMEAVARLAPARTTADADAALATLTERLDRDFNATNRGWRAHAVALVDDQLGYYRPAIIVLFGAVSLLALIGCLNVASLVLTRALARDREIAVRTALGASPRHLVTQLLAEALVLSMAGAAIGTLAAMLALPAITAATPVEIPRLAEAALNWRVLLFAVGLASAATVVFGVVPGLVLIRRNVSTDLKSGERGSSRGSRFLYRALVTGEVALACALLISSGLLVRTVARMMDVPLGIGAPEVVTASVQLQSGAPQGQPPDWRAIAASYSALLDHVRRQPGVRAAGAANFLPLDPGWRLPFTIQGWPPMRAEELPQAQIQSVSEGYFDAIGARLLHGRLFTAQDHADAPGAVVVNESFVRRFFAAEPALGQIYLTTSRAIGPLGWNLMTPPRPPAAPGAPPPPAPPSAFEIVGIVADVKNVPLGQATEPAVYFSARQYPFLSMFVAIQADVPAAVAALGAALRQHAPGVPVHDVRTWATRLDVRTAEPRLLMTLLVVFAALAAGLAALGLYGLFSWTVALRRRELAIRLTLGARPMAIGTGVIRQGALLVGLGLVAGWGIVLTAERVLSRVLFGVTPSDPASTAGAAGVLVVSALAACVPPAVRAMRTDPVEGLRNE